jgi:hypothetical protein
MYTRGPCLKIKGFDEGMNFLDHIMTSVHAYTDTHSKIVWEQQLEFLFGKSVLPNSLRFFETIDQGSRTVII